MDYITQFTVIFTVSLVVFFLTNYIGGISIGRGYVSINAGTIQDGQMLFNWLYKIFFPILFCILIGTIFYSFDYPEYTKNLWLSVLICWCIRLCHNLLFQRFSLMNKFEFFILFVFSISISYFINFYLNKNPKLALPSWDNIISEIWLLSFFFIYQIFNNFNSTNEKTVFRKNYYFKNKYLEIKAKYQPIISSLTPSVECEKLIYSIIIYENFNRPFLVRKIENFLAPYRKIGSYGIMQVSSNKLLSDTQSVELGGMKIIDIYNKVEKTTVENQTEDINKWTYFAILRRVIWLYNNSDDYVVEVCQIHDFLESTFYTEQKEKNMELLFDANYSRWD